MAFPCSPKLPPFTATTLIDRIRTTFRAFPDERRGGNHQRYTLEDAALSAFSVFFTQSPSFLDYQRRMQRRLGQNNAQSLFGSNSHFGLMEWNDPQKTKQDKPINRVKLPLNCR